jgi:hypothetical protein
MGKALKFHFEGHTFPTVRTIIVPDHGHDILRCCPEARKVVCNYGDGSRIITAIGKYCKNVEIVEDIKPDKNFLKRMSSFMANSRSLLRVIGFIGLAKACPNLRELKFNPGIETKTVSSCQILMVVILTISHLDRSSSCTHALQETHSIGYPSHQKLR